LRSRALLALLVAALATRAVEAQARTQLTVAGWPLSATSTSAAEFEAGAVALGSTAFTVDLTDTNKPLGNRSTTVEVQCVPACPRSGTLPVAGLQWRRDDQATWTALTTTYTIIETRVATWNGVNDPWSRTMFWRYALTWAGNPPTAESEFRISYRLTVAAP
jgi:hypothetical protein